jgi:heme/copper-type cytochrome/quinol oxidase subunit 2
MQAQEGDNRRAGAIWALGALGILAIAGISATSAGMQAPREHEIRVTAGRYAFEPAVIRIQRGDTLTLRFAATDVVHGFYLEGHDLDVTIAPLSLQVEVKRAGARELVDEVVLVAERSGKFRYRCSKTCGAMHPFMVGELVVGPNHLFRASAASAIGLLLGGLAWVRLRSPEERSR